VINYSQKERYQTKGKLTGETQINGKLKKENHRKLGKTQKRNPNSMVKLDQVPSNQ
jgi:hypothetical protein